MLITFLITRWLRPWKESENVENEFDTIRKNTPKEIEQKATRGYE